MLDKNIINLVPEAKKYVIATVVYQAIMLFINILMLWYLAKGIRLYLSNSLTSIMFIKYIIGVTLLVILTRSFFTYRASKASFKASYKVKLVLRNRILETMFKKDGDIAPFTEAELIQLSCEGVEQIESYMSKYVPQFFYSLLAPITLFIVIMQIDLLSALVLLLSVPLIPMLIIIIRKKSTSVMQKYWNKYTDVGSSFLECLYGLTTLKINNQDQKMQNTLSTRAEKFRVATMNVLGMQLHSITIMDLVAYGASSIGMLMSVISLYNNRIDLASSIFIILVASEFFLPLRLLGSYFHLASTGQSAAIKIFSFLNKEEENKKALGIVDIHKTYEVNNLSFSYGDKLVLKNINMSLPEKGLVCLVGPSGCGKTTLAKIFSKKLVCDNVKLFGQNLKDLDQSIIYSKVCYVPSNPKIYGRTVREAINESKDALKKVNLDLDLDLELKDNCSNLSGGQKQRLGLARALDRASNVLILDESTSNIDSDNEYKILEEIKNISKTKLVLLITHRMKLSKLCDLVFSLNNGEIESSGSFKTVYKNSNSFKTLFDKQRDLEEN